MGAVDLSFVSFELTSNSQARDAMKDSGTPVIVRECMRGLNRVASMFKGYLSLRLVFVVHIPFFRLLCLVAFWFTSFLNYKLAILMVRFWFFMWFMACWMPFEHGGALNTTMITFAFLTIPYFVT